MKSTLKFLLAAAVALLLAGCNGGNYGYPSGVNFSKDGGVKVAQGDDGFYNLEINDYNGDGPSQPVTMDTKDTVAVTSDWLTVKYVPGEHQVTIAAAPNTTGRSRHRWFYGMVDDGFAEIKVTQE